MRKKIAAPPLSPRQAAVDRLGALKAEIASLQETHDRLEAKLRGKLGTVEGSNFRICVFDVSGTKFDWTKAKRLLGERYAKCWQPNDFRSSKLVPIDKPDIS